MQGAGSQHPGPSAGGSRGDLVGDTGWAAPLLPPVGGLRPEGQQTAGGEGVCL